MTDPADEPTDDPTEGNVDAGWFRRFRFSPDQAETVRQQIGLSCRAIDDGLGPADLLAHLLELTWALPPLERETEAVSFGRVALELARAGGDSSSEIEALLHTATALQYAGEPAEARALFEAGIDVAARTGETGNLHYLQHHLGRLAAEALDSAGAAELFETALAQRREIGDEALIRSTETALAELTAWIDRHQP